MDKGLCTLRLGAIPVDYDLQVCREGSLGNGYDTNLV